MTVADTQPIPSLGDWVRKASSSVTQQDETPAEATQPISRVMTLGDRGAAPLPRPPRVNVIKVPGSRTPEPVSPAEQAVSAEALVQVQPNETAPARPPLPVRKVGQSLLDQVSVEEKLADPTGQATALQAAHPEFIIWYGTHTREFWVLGRDLRSYQSYSSMIQSMGWVPAPI